MIRALTPWWLLRLIDRYSNYCWAELVVWKMAPQNETSVGRVGQPCFSGLPMCYCGKFTMRNGQACRSERIPRQELDVIVSTIPSREEGNP